MLRPPLPSPLFTGRDAELERLSRALERVPVAWIYGVAGVGKTTLACAYAERRAGPVVFAHATTGSLDALLDDARLALGPRARPEPRRLDERIADLVRRLESRAACLILDDAHVVGDVTSAELALTFAAQLRKGRVVFTSRHRLVSSARAPDRLELGLSGLPKAEAKILWGSLDELYGEVAGFERALERSRGNPLLLRRAHAGGSSDSAEVGGELAEIGPEGRQLALTLAVVPPPLPRTALAAVMAGGFEAALSALSTALAVDVDANGAVRLHDLFREALLATAPSGELDRARQTALDVLARSELLPAELLRETTRQLAKLGRFAELDTFLTERATEMVQAGATGELLRSMDALPADRRSLALTIERARCMGRHFDMRSAYDELRRLMSETDAPPIELRYAFAELAYDLCRPAEVIETLRPVLEDAGLEVEMRVRCLARYAAAFTVVGRGEEGRALLRAAEEQIREPTLRARLALHEAMLLNADERYDEAAATLGRARLLWDSTAIDENAVYAPLLCAVMYARAGRFEESDALLAKLRLDAPTDDESAEIFVLASRASLAFERGARLEALGHRVEAQRMNQLLGGVHYDLVGAMWHARNLFALGRAREARSELGRARREAEALGCHAIVERFDRTRLFDPRLHIERLPAAAPSSDKRGEAARHWSLSALRRASARDAPGAALAIAEALRLATGPGYGLDRGVCHLARALADGVADASRLESVLAEARAEAERDGADLDVVDELARWASEELRAPSVRLSEVVIDRAAHELVHGGEITSLKTRPVVRRLLYALAERAGRAVSKEDLVREVWRFEYDPRRHDTPLWQNVRRLRQVVSGTGLAIEVDDDGYRLVSAAPLTVRGSKPAR